LASLNNISDEINKSFLEMISSVQTIDSNDHTKLHAFIEKHLPPKKFEKKQFGEVFTPLSLVQEMLNAITKYADKNFWSNPDLKILDPASGIGNFPLIAYELLMDGLKKEIPNEEKRRKHILEKILYMVELNPINSRLMSRIFNGKKYKLNILNTSFLDDTEGLNKQQLSDHIKLEKWKEMKFDLIMGNPPFQAPPKSDKKTSGSTALWPDFVKHSINCISSNGFLVFVHPSGWRKPENEKSKYYGMYKLMTKENHMYYLEIHNIEDGQKIFNSGTRYDWYIIKKTKSILKTIIINEHKNKSIIDLKKTPWLPNYNFKIIFDKLLAKDNEKKCDIIYQTSAYESRKPWVKDDAWILKHPREAKNYKKILIHSTPQKGVRYMWTNEFNKDKYYKTPMFGIPKVIFGDSGIYNPIIDKIGQYGMTNHVMAIHTNISELKLLANFLISKEFKDILNSCSWSNYQIDWNLFSYFKDKFWHL
jgi:hypothetical protein